MHRGCCADLCGCVLHDFLSRRFWWERLNGAGKTLYAWNAQTQSQKLLNRQQSVIRTTLEYLRKQNRQIRLDERYSDGIRLICNDYIPVPNFCIFKIKRLMIERT